MSDDLATLAADAFIYGFPLVFDLQMVGGQAEMGMITPAPFNSFSHASRLAGSDDRFVSINNDTIYSIAQVDVSGGPGAGAGKQKMEAALTAGGLAPVVNGWTLTFRSSSHRPPSWTAPTRSRPSPRPRAEPKGLR